MGPQFTRENQIRDRDVMMVLRKQEATKFEPGSRYEYSNSGYAVLAQIVEKASGMSFAGFLKKNIFDALGMKGTVVHEEGTSVVRDRAYGYSKRGDAFERTDQSATSAVLGDGGVYSSVEDLFRWDQALYGTRLVKRETWRQAVTPGILNSGKPTEYGFGWQIGTHNGHTVWHHGGGTIGFLTYIARFPEDRLTVIVLFNRLGLDPSNIAFQIADQYL
jgi:CubicO group peptidase (beta-lactamase class C family)